MSQHPETIGLPLFEQTPTHRAGMLDRVREAMGGKPLVMPQPGWNPMQEELDRELGASVDSEAPPEPPVDGHEAAAREWMAQHPHAMKLFSRLAQRAAMSGRRFGMKALAERVRWEFAIERGDDTYKINNNYVAYIGRELVRRHPELAKLIEFRQTKGENQP